MLGFGFGVGADGRVAMFWPRAASGVKLDRPPSPTRPWSLLSLKLSSCCFCSLETQELSGELKKKKKSLHASCPPMLGVGQAGFFFFFF